MGDKNIPLIVLIQGYPNFLYPIRNLGYTNTTWNAAGTIT